jgi:Flp pilus assembly protein TadG
MKRKHLYRDQRGGTLVEFTIVLPVFLSLTFGIIQAGLMLWAQVGLQHGVEMAARCASLGDIGNAAANASTVKSFAASNSWGINPPASSFTVDPASPNCPGGNLVTASYPFTAIQYLFSITLTAQSCYPTAS